jgi:hypothetical protein
MNILINQFPEIVTINGREIPLNTDFRACLHTMLAFEDPQLTMNEKQAVLLSNLYLEPPDDLRGAMKKAQWFLNMGQESKESDGGPRLYSFSKDAPFIFAAFRQTHGIDLQTAELHWWAFLALFMDLGSDTFFCQLTALRKRVKNGKASKEEKAAASEMGDLFDVPDTEYRTIEELEMQKDFEQLVARGKRKRDEEPNITS